MADGKSARAIVIGIATNGYWLSRLSHELREALPLAASSGLTNACS